MLLCLSAAFPCLSKHFMDDESHVTSHCKNMMVILTENVLTLLHK